MISGGTDIHKNMNYTVQFYNTIRRETAEW